MLSMNLKRKVAVLLTGVMVLGMSVTAFANTPASPWDTAQTGTGEFEGHVNREVLAVDLPTIKAGHVPFNYVLDSEGLIAETKAVAYGGWDENFGVTREATTNVYFKQEDDKYYNESQAYTVSNNSSVSLNVTVKVGLPAYADGDVLFVKNESDLPEDQEPTASEKNDAKIYLALKVGDEKKALKPGETISLNKVLADGYANYYVSQNSTAPSGSAHGYDFVISENKVAAAGAHPWDDVAFSLVGKANKVKDASGVKAPNLTLTWEYSKYEAPAAPAAPTEFTVTFDSNGGSDVAAQTVVDGELAEEPAAPTKDEDADYTYEFEAWYSDEELETAFDFSTPIDADITLYAKWTATAKVVVGTLATEKVGSSWYATLKGKDGADLAADKLTALTINTIDFKNKAVFTAGMYGVSLDNLIAGGVAVTSGSTMIANYTVDGVNYTASYTIP